MIDLVLDRIYIYDKLYVGLPNLQTDIIHDVRLQYFGCEVGHTNRVTKKEQPTYYLFKWVDLRYKLDRVMSLPADTVKRHISEAKGDQKVVIKIDDIYCLNSD